MKPVLAALGIINALGQGKQDVLDHLLAGTAPGMVPLHDRVPGRTVHAGTVTASLPAIDDVAQNSRNNRLLLAALQEIQPAIGRAIEQCGHNRIGVVIGSSTSGIAEGEAALAHRQQHRHWPMGYDFRQQETGSPALFVAQRLGIDGPALTVSTACSSSAKAFASARQLLALGLCDAVICGGADSLCDLTLNGFAALESMASAHCEPFAAGRDGINIGEGAALFLLENRQPQPGDIVLAGVGESADAHHISAPHPEGTGAEAAMRAALADTALAPADIHYINVHGTATPLNDAMESAAVARVFGTATPCSSTKPLTGHMLGAAGATEAALCWLLLSGLNGNRTLPAQCNSAPPDSTLAPIAILRSPATLPIATPVSMLSNSFAFGGSNAAVILSRW